MPYDITDAKEDVQILTANQNYILDILKKKFPEEFKEEKNGIKVKT